MSNKRSTSKKASKTKTTTSLGDQREVAQQLDTDAVSNGDHRSQSATISSDVIVAVSTKSPAETTKKTTAPSRYKQYVYADYCDFDPHAPRQYVDEDEYSPEYAETGQTPEDRAADPEPYYLEPTYPIYERSTTISACNLAEKAAPVCAFSEAHDRHVNSRYVAGFSALGKIFAPYNREPRNCVSSLRTFQLHAAAHKPLRRSTIPLEGNHGLLNFSFVHSLDTKETAQRVHADKYLVGATKVSKKAEFRFTTSVRFITDKPLSVLQAKHSIGILNATLKSEINGQHPSNTRISGIVCLHAESHVRPSLEVTVAAHYLSEIAPGYSHPLHTLPITTGLFTEEFDLTSLDRATGVHRFMDATSYAQALQKEHHLRRPPVFAYTPTVKYKGLVPITTRQKRALVAFVARNCRSEIQLGVTLSPFLRATVVFEDRPDQAPFLEIYLDPAILDGFFIYTEDKDSDADEFGLPPFVIKPEKEPKPVKEPKVKTPKLPKEPKVKPVKLPKEPKPVKEPKVKAVKLPKEPKVKEPKPIKEPKVKPVKLPKEPKPVKEPKVKTPKLPKEPKIKPEKAPKPIKEPKVKPVKLPKEPKPVKEPKVKTPKLPKAPKPAKEPQDEPKETPEAEISEKSIEPGADEVATDLDPEKAPQS
jgi:hypothetical protein